MIFNSQIQDIKINDLLTENEIAKKEKEIAKKKKKLLKKKMKK